MSEHDKTLPCDVMLPPATIIHKGCDWSVLEWAIMARKGKPPEDCRFGDILAAHFHAKEGK